MPNWHYEFWAKNRKMAFSISKESSFLISNPNGLQITMLLTFEIFGRARNHGKKFLKLFQTSFSGIVHSALTGQIKSIVGLPIQGNFGISELPQTRFPVYLPRSSDNNGQCHGTLPQIKTLAPSHCILRPFGFLLYRRIHSKKFSATSGDQLEHNGGQGASGSD